MEQSLGDRGHHQIALAAALETDQRIHPELPDGAQHGLEVTVRQALLHVEGRGGWHERLAGKGTSDELDKRLGQMRDVAESFVLDPLADAEAATQQMSAVDLALVAAHCGGHMNSAGSRRHAEAMREIERNVKKKLRYLVATTRLEKLLQILALARFTPQERLGTSD